MAEFDRNNAIAEEMQNKKKRMILSGIIICIILILLLAFMVIHYKNVDAKTFKLFLNGGKDPVECSSDFCIRDEKGNPYVKAKELAKLLGWTYQNGEYGSYTEDSDSCCIFNEYEAASIKVGSDILKKYIQSSEIISQYAEGGKKEEVEEGTIIFQIRSNNGMVESSKLKLPIISSNGQMYIPFSCINDICNCYGTYEEYRMNIYSQNQLAQIALNNATGWGYTSVSGIYENSRALAYGMMVVEKSGLYGVVNLFNNESVLGFKYTDMVFCQNVKEFLVKTKDNSGVEKVGLVSYKGDVIISPKGYDNISILSDELGLYLVKRNEKYGVLNRDGKIIVHAEYDSIGLSEEQVDEYEYSSDDNKYLIYNNTIVVEANGKYGLYNIDGKAVLDTVYDGIGYINSVEDEDSSVARADIESVLTMDVEVNSNGSSGNVKGIVVKFNSRRKIWIWGL